MSLVRTLSNIMVLVMGIHQSSTCANLARLGWMVLNTSLNRWKGHLLFFSSTMLIFISLIGPAFATLAFYVFEMGQSKFWDSKRFSLGSMTTLVFSLLALC